ncbi:MAG: bifunctional riboflavin kinase/FAD synthetase [Desulfobacterales bacterium]|nr:bifunctional riboflavin kinase/FAD synthetase [Desulfobacterales bacterium]MDD4071139.1 bifunctional riboflavin kinase/FAD synthetase [Desulfobacterales bacterium]MDD4392575.1 bifunctional riboflavin kinase/FAD synthetase [Desulfobacterales bacterium]
MQLIERLEDIKQPYKNAVITIGNFDGVHIGHQALFQEVIEKADSIVGTSIAMTFDPHPIKFLNKNGPPQITLYEQKIELIEKSNIDVLICTPFSKEFSELTARQFVEDILVKRIGVKAVIVGGDYMFGRNREGNLDLLKTYGLEYGFEVIIADWINTSDKGNERISSTKIRELVMDGQIEKARKLLGRHYQIKGTVVTGRNRGGKLLGFPTANIHLDDELCPKIGVYAVTVQYRDKRYKGVANIGYSPTFDDHIYTIEIHILDFNENIYREDIRVNFIKRLRDEIKFSDIHALSEQIKTDIAVARRIISL